MEYGKSVCCEIVCEGCIVGDSNGGEEKNIYGGKI